MISTWSTQMLNFQIITGHHWRIGALDTSIGGHVVVRRTISWWICSGIRSRSWHGSSRGRRSGGHTTVAASSAVTSCTGD